MEESQVSSNFVADIPAAEPQPANGFETLGLSPEILKAVADSGYTTPTPIQAQGIPKVLERRDLIGIAQTGTGKTASFTLPMIEMLARGRAKARMPRSLILEPTRELAAQVAESFEKYGKYNKLSMALLIGGTSFEDQDKKLDRGVDVLIATPGRLLDHFERGKLMLSQVNILVIDEADRMLDMGFIPDVERICKLLPFTRQTLFYSATMPPEITRLTEQFLHNPARIEVARPATAASTITQELVQVPANDWAKREALRRLIREAGEITNAIVFCNRKRDVDIVAKSLQKHGFNAAPLHGDLDQSLRMKTLEGFRTGAIQLLVASDVAARGLDISSVSHVFNFDVPFHPDDYIHRIGRTGRAGRIGFAYTLVTPRDDKQVDAIEKLMKLKINRRVMSDIEVREDRGTRREERGGRGGDRRGGRDRGRRGDRFKPEKYHDHVASMEPTQVVDAPAVADAAAPVEQPVAKAPREHKPRQDQRPRHEKKHEPRREQQGHQAHGQQAKREKPHRAHQDRKNDATPVKPERHELPAFLFRPINLPKKADA
ncbi:MAG: DEAD/DEAH box helicase [Alphaproteobacteria bacterium]|nr:DEAD/DEAH box helicase [Alphaproteobacteria bacterium]MBL6939266.1 DEAD/DEAH box helicase [Alphaproteobacteria bacterium]MBL7096782.1 DEAD/DEAH box helicase [Alphaproteobacteria bacterium]